MDPGPLPAISQLLAFKLYYTFFSFLFLSKTFFLFIYILVITISFLLLPLNPGSLHSRLILVLDVGRQSRQTGCSRGCSTITFALL